MRRKGLFSWSMTCASRSGLLLCKASAYRSRVAWMPAWISSSLKGIGCDGSGGTLVTAAVGGPGVTVGTKVAVGVAGTLVGKSAWHASCESNRVVNASNGGLAFVVFMNPLL